MQTERRSALTYVKLQHWAHKHAHLRDTCVTQAKYFMNTTLYNISRYNQCIEMQLALHKDVRQTQKYPNLSKSPLFFFLLLNFLIGQHYQLIFKPTAVLGQFHH